MAKKAAVAAKHDLKLGTRFNEDTKILLCMLLDNAKQAILDDLLSDPIDLGILSRHIAMVSKRIDGYSDDFEMGANGSAHFDALEKALRVTPDEYESPWRSIETIISL